MILRTLLTVTLTLFLIIAFTPLITSAENIYVPDDYKTIQAAVDAANKGDTIIVRDGTYSPVHIDMNHLTIQSENGSAQTIIQSGLYVFRVTADYVHITGFTIKEGGKWGAIWLNSNNSNIHENTIINGSGQGITIGPGTRNNTITNNTIVNSDYSGIFLCGGSTNNTIIGNTIEDNRANGIELSGQNNDNNISGNIINNNGQGIMMISQCNNNTISGNTVNNSRREGIRLDTGNNDNIISWNNIHKNRYEGIILLSWSFDLKDENKNKVVSDNTIADNGVDEIEGLRKEEK